jgi:succinyl-diaminopimelate desuccinylase
MTQPDDLRNRLIALTRDLILIPSTETRPAERHRAIQFVANHLEAIDRVDVRQFESNGFTSLVALPQGIKHPAIILGGHVDVVENPDLDVYGSTIHEGRIIGPGAGDMKGAVAIEMELFRQWHTEHPGVSLGLVITSDEESGGADGVKHLIERGVLSGDRAIVPDGGSLNDLTVEEKGVLHARLRCRGRAAHAARPWLADNAVEHLTLALARVIEHFRQLLPASIDPDDDHWFPTCSVSTVHTDNRSHNRVPDEAEAILDVRFPPPHSIDSMIAEISELVGPSITIDPVMTADPTHLSPDPLFSEVTEQITGRPVRLVRASAGSDARFMVQAGIPVNLSRPHVGNLHAQDEWIQIDSMVAYYRLCDEYLRRKLADPAG